MELSRCATVRVVRCSEARRKVSTMSRSANASTEEVTDGRWRKGGGG